MQALMPLSLISDSKKQTLWAPRPNGAARTSVGKIPYKSKTAGKC